MNHKPRISFCTHFYNGAHVLQMQIDELKKLSAPYSDLVELLIVDDYSDEPYELDIGKLNAKMYRITTDIDWNMAGCKNLLMAEAQADWLLFFDNDNYTSAQNVQLLLTHLNNLEPTTIFYFKRLAENVEVETHINTFLAHRSALTKIGGFDEDFCGHYGYEDVHFINLLEKLGFERRLIPDLEFIQQNYRTSNLDRDLSRNRMLLTKKIEAGMQRPNGNLRFKWQEVRPSLKFKSA